jgi:hypothetical protein
MRRAEDSQTLDPGSGLFDVVRFERRTSLSSFCFVCQYILIDQLDPGLYGRIDLDSRYPYLV